MKLKNGFTLLELVVTTTLMSIIASIVLVCILAPFNGYYASQTLIPLASNASIAMSSIMSELKNAQAITTINTSNNQNFTTKTLITFTNPSNQTIQYVLTKNATNTAVYDLIRSVDGARQVIFTPVVIMSMTFYDQNLSSVTASNATNVRYIMAYLKTYATTSSNGNTALYYSTATGTTVRALISAQPAATVN